MQELTDAIRSLENEKAVGPDGVSVELFKITLNGDPAQRRRLLNIVVHIWTGGEVRQQLKDAIIMVFHKKKDRTEHGNYKGSTFSVPLDGYGECGFYVVHIAVSRRVCAEVPSNRYDHLRSKLGISHQASTVHWRLS